ncbi:hypothetical protein SCLCIDRAFT_1223439 [Scleroderma citrinum Foug A]|uniref:Uncharacterized protein n=1 Tax=Scleroderma citrinum Foug A TaxID=1036808 RepID=A0A0C3D8S4_9AGAM|nr:hypothetical protein SCLCIDRAFT_1223439 [Scleroderma citrinum Foug A]
MDWFSHDSNEAKAYNQVTGEHKAPLSHELIAAAASYEAAKAYEKHREANGHFENHAKAKEFLGGATGFFIDHVVESKGLNHIDNTMVTGLVCIGHYPGAKHGNFHSQRTR